MRKLLVAALVVASTLVVAPGTAHAADVLVSVVHGLGPAPNAVDVYVDGALTIEDYQFEELFSTNLAAGTYTVQLCTAQANPPANIVDCPTVNVTPNGGVEVPVDDVSAVTWVAAYEPTGPTAGRPTVLAFVDDTDCIDEGDARVSVYHAATAPAVDLLLDDEVVLGDIQPAEAVSEDIDPGVFDLAIEPTGSDVPVITATGVDITAAKDNNYVVVGNPQQQAEYTVIARDRNLSTCVVPTSSSTTSTALANNGAAAATAVSGNAAYAG